ncbi:TolC family protein [Methylobacterium nonmethylotrophicum]|jgi:hypothetical protein|uniref:TolC family protein n=1 Tax=Methylobacterium nonmethylotrophicum TaxID=1141884 RepID=UPI003CCAD347
MRPMPPRRIGSYAPSLQREGDLPLPEHVARARRTAGGASDRCHRIGHADGDRSSSHLRWSRDAGKRSRVSTVSICRSIRAAQVCGGPTRPGRPGRLRGFIGGKNLAGRSLKQTTRPSGAGLTVNQTLFNDVQIGNSSRRAEASVLSQRETLHFTELTTPFNAGQAYSIGSRISGRRATGGWLLRRRAR